MRKKNINLREEEARTQEFLQKLNKFKSTSVAIKEKNKHTKHKNEWFKYNTILGKLETQLTNELEETLKNLDRDYNTQVREIFENDADEKNKANNFGEYSQEIEQKREIYELSFWYQAQLLREGVKKFQAGDKAVTKDEIKQLIQDVKSFFGQMDGILEQEAADYEKVRKEIEEYVQMAHETDNVAGFDQELNIDLDFQFQQFLSDSIQKVLDAMMEQYFKGQHLIDERYRLEFIRLEDTFQRQATVPKELDQNGKEVFRHIYKTYIKRGLDRDLYMERLAMQFPKMTRKELEQYDAFITSQEFYNKRKKALNREWVREKTNMKELAEEQILRQIEEKIAETAKELERLKTNKELARLHQIIQEKREEFEARRAEREAQLNEERRRNEELKKLKQEKFLEHASKVKQVAKVYGDEKKEKQERDRMLREAEQRRKNEEIKATIAKNQPIVAKRQAKEIGKIEEKVHQKELKKKAVIENAERINKAIESYPFRPKVEADFERVIKDTEALEKRKATTLDKADKVNLFKVHGYNIKELMGDIRYKIGAALFEAGLDKTDYGKTLMVALSRGQNQNPSS